MKRIILSLVLIIMSGSFANAHNDVGDSLEYGLKDLCGQEFDIAVGETEGINDIYLCSTVSVAVMKKPQAIRAGIAGNLDKAKATCESRNKVAKEVSRKELVRYDMVGNAQKIKEISVSVISRIECK